QTEYGSEEDQGATETPEEDNA
ncbi:MAG: hypothetical protein JWM42_129, partial [Burkholderia sp.]|nr:hypothetical protein [Burkholderia sp.]